MELGSVFLLGDISLFDGYSESRASHLSNMLREHVFVFVNQSIMQSIDIYLIIEKGFVQKLVRIIVSKYYMLFCLISEIIHPR